MFRPGREKELLTISCCKEWGSRRALGRRDEESAGRGLDLHLCQPLLIYKLELVTPVLTIREFP